jgi:glycosyltransferase involved in cell wall biosynthesis
MDENRAQREQDGRDNPLVSVILLGWQRVDFLTRAMESVFAQTYPNWELVLMDQQEISHRFAPLLSQYKKRVRIICGRFDTPAAAAQYGIEFSRGEYLTFLDDDNWKDESFIEKMLNFSLETNCPVVVCNSRIVTEDGIEEAGVICRTPKPSMVTFGLLQTDNYIDFGEIFISRDFFNYVGGLQTDLMGLQDWDLVLRCARENVFRGGIPVLSEALHSYRQHSGQLTFRPDKQMLWAQIRKELKEKYNLRIFG